MSTSAARAIERLGVLWLASKSPRRQVLLREAGIEAISHPADIDDGVLRHGQVPPEWWVMSLAYLKAQRVAAMLRASGNRQSTGTILGADTVCAIGRTVLGQPVDGEDARRMLLHMRERDHRTLTGICLLPIHRRDARLIAFDAAVVRIGELTEAQIDAYVQSEQWRGKAGAYNFADRVAAGWPITCVGDPTTVMGLPMQRLAGWLMHAADLWA